MASFGWTPLKSAKVRQLSIGPGPAGTLIIAGDSDNPIPMLIQNVDPVNIVYLGESVNVNPAVPASCAPLAPGQSAVASGDKDVFAIAAPGQTVAINTYSGMMSFFQPLSQLVIAGPLAAVLIYNPVAGPGNLVGSWASIAYTDQYGNAVPAGLNATQGTLTSMILQAATSYNEDLIDPIIEDGLLTSPVVNGGTLTEVEITFDTTDGFLLMYGTVTTTVSFTTPGHTTWTSPVTGTAVVRAWGADGGAGGGGSTWGGTGGGGGEYGGEAHYQLNASQVYTVDVGAGGKGGSTNNTGNPGGDSGFDNFSVIGGGGNGGGLGGQGGNKSTNSYHFHGGNGAGSGAGGGSGGGGRAGSTGPGGNGTVGGSSAGGAGGAAGTGIGGATGANGGSSGTNGANGPAGGGGAGQAPAAQSGTLQYWPYTTSYYGSDGSSPNGIRIYESSPFYQGGETSGGGSYNGTQKSLLIWNGNPSADLAGKTVDWVNIQLTNQHSWYGSGMYVGLGYNNRTSFPNTWDASDLNNIGSFWINQGATTTFEISGIAGALQSGACRAIGVGPGTPAYNLWNYGYFAGQGSGSGPLLNIGWHSGTAAKQGGNGGNGRVDIIYTSSQALVGALSPVAGTDQYSNAYGVGYTGQVQAFQPSSNPTVVETWHTLALPSGITGGACRYKLVAEGSCLLLDITCVFPATAATYTFPSLPAGYVPSIPGNQPRIYANLGNAGTTAVGQVPRLFISASGGMQLIVSGGGGGTASWTILLPMN